MAHLSKCESNKMINFNPFYYVQTAKYGEYVKVLLKITFKKTHILSVMWGVWLRFSRSVCGAISQNYMCLTMTSSRGALGSRVIMWLRLQTIAGNYKLSCQTCCFCVCALCCCFLSATWTTHPVCYCHCCSPHLSLYIPQFVCVCLV